MMIGRHLTTLTAIFLPMWGPAALAAGTPAQPCPLQEIESLDATILPDGMFAIPAHVNDRPVMLGVDPGSIGTYINATTMTALGLEPTLAYNREAFVNNVIVQQTVTLKTLALGKLQITDWPVWVIPDGAVSDGIAGLIGSSDLRSFDVEFDPSHRKLNLFAPNTCTKDAAYWTHGAAAALPFTLDNDGHIVVQAQLDGKPLSVTLDTGATTSFMNEDSAESLFGLRESQLTLDQKVRVNGGKETLIYRYSFSALDLQGVKILNPAIELMSSSAFGRGFRDSTDMVLGENTLKRLRIYVAYTQGVIYLTDADAH
jgi:predicted aspartyl protease